MRQDARHSAADPAERPDIGMRLGAGRADVRQTDALRDGFRRASSAPVDSSRKATGPPVSAAIADASQTPSGQAEPD